MDVRLLEKDGRCRWLENQVLKGLFPAMRASAEDPDRKTLYLIEDWVSNDHGKVGADLGWLRALGIPLLPSVKELPKGSDYAVVNTGYDAIVDEEVELIARGIEYHDHPCPFIRKIRRELESWDPAYQCVLLCEPNHIIIKNYRAIFPEDMILVQMGNFEERLLSQSNGKPFRLVPYVTFLQSHVERILHFMQERFPGRAHTSCRLACMWASGPQSPLTEIEQLDEASLDGISKALLLATPGSTNKSLESLLEVLRKRGLAVEIISSLENFHSFEAAHPEERVLLVRSPIPNQVEQPVLEYLRRQGSAFPLRATAPALEGGLP